MAHLSLLSMLALQVASSSSPSSNANYSGNYTGSFGALLPGDLIDSGNFTTADAEARCDALPHCVGFTWAVLPTHPPSLKVHTYFSASRATNTDTRWFKMENGRKDECGLDDASPGSNAGQMNPPTDMSKAGVAGWLANITAWRKACLNAQNYNGSVYTVAALKWTQTTEIQPQSHPYDRFLWDPVQQKHTVDIFLSDLKSRYGGIDSVLIWPTYTNIGIDNRNQYDMIRSMPGGVPGIKRLVDKFHAQGVKVLLPFHPWDVGTRRELCGDTLPAAMPQPGCKKIGDLMDDADAMAALQLATGADGFNGDTMGLIPESFYDAAMARGHPIALEPEGSAPVTAVGYDTLNWGEGWKYTVPPRVDTKKWLTSGLHQTNICDRWNQNKAALASTALFNGIGMESWENVWGTWNGMTPRDSQIYIRLGALLRFMGGHTEGGGAQPDAVSTRSLLRTKGWTPFLPLVSTPSKAYASTFPSDDGSEVLITIVSFAQGSTATFEVDLADHTNTNGSSSGSYTVYDVWHGTKLAGTRSTSGRTMQLSVPLDDSLLATGGCVPGDVCPGYGAVLLTKMLPGNDNGLQAYLSRMKTLTAKQLSDYPCEGGSHCAEGGKAKPVWPFYNACTATQCAGLSIKAAMKVNRTVAHASPPTAEMVHLNGGVFNFSTHGVMLEGDTAQGVDIQFPWESSPRKDHAGQVTINAMYVDKYPVTNIAYHTFVTASKYVPADTEHYLQHWQKKGSTAPSPLPGWEKKPVTYVSLQDARTYCAYYGKRLPELPEWQWLAGQNVDQAALYPWGNAAPSNATAGGAGPTTGFSYGGPRDVDALPAGCTNSGVCDVVGNAWEMSTEYQDQHTRSVVLLGGSNYRPSGSGWYFPQAWQINTHEKYMLYSSGYERAATIGFRCIADSK